MGSQRVRHDWATKHSIQAWNLPGTSDNESPASARDVRDVGSIPGSRRCPGGGHGNSLQYSCLENPVDSEAWQATVHGVSKNQYWSSLAHTRMPTHTHTHVYVYICTCIYTYICICVCIHKHTISFINLATANWFHYCLVFKGGLVSISNGLLFIYLFSNRLLEY